MKKMIFIGILILGSISFGADRKNINEMAKFIKKTQINFKELKKKSPDLYHKTIKNLLDTANMTEKQYHDNMDELLKGRYAMYSKTVTNDSVDAITKKYKDLNKRLEVIILN